jgi:hypothetical protein
MFALAMASSVSKRLRESTSDSSSSESGEPAAKRGPGPLPRFENPKASSSAVGKGFNTLSLAEASSSAVGKDATILFPHDEEKFEHADVILERRQAAKDAKLDAMIADIDAYQAELAHAKAVEYAEYYGLTPPPGLPQPRALYDARYAEESEDNSDNNSDDDTDDDNGGPDSSVVMTREELMANIDKTHKKRTMWWNCLLNRTACDGWSQRNWTDKQLRKTLAKMPKFDRGARYGLELVDKGPNEMWHRFGRAWEGKNRERWLQMLDGASGVVQLVEPSDMKGNRIWIREINKAALAASGENVSEEVSDGEDGDLDEDLNEGEELDEDEEYDGEDESEAEEVFCRECLVARGLFVWQTCERLEST